MTTLSYYLKADYIEYFDEFGIIKCYRGDDTLIAIYQYGILIYSLSN